MRKKLSMLAIAIITATMAIAQIKMPAASPTFTEKGAIGLAEVTVEYSRPSAAGRKVFGDLVPYGELWRTGANASTKISFSEDVTLNGNPLKAGKYALYTIPGESEWTIVLSNNLTWWGTGGYTEAEDALRFKVPAGKVSSHYETFTIGFSDITTNTANLNIKWEGTKVSFKIENEVDSKIMAQIKEQVIDKKPENAGAYYQAGSYYFATNRELDKALDFINKAIDGGNNGYWVYHLKAKIEAKLGKKADAKATAKKSMDMAKEAGNMDYVRLNEKLMAEL